MAFRIHDRLMLWFILIFTVFLEIYVSLLVFGYSIHSLERHGNWESVKIAAGHRIMCLMGALEFMHERQALAGNRLNLGSWWGFQEVVWKHPVSKLKEIRFSFALQKKAYLYFLFNRDRDGGHAFRLSANEIFPSMFAELDQSGKFLKKEPLETGLRPYRWYSVRVIFDDETVTMYVDNLLLTHLNIRVKSLQALGFRAGEENASIDDFSIVKSGK